jgi:hypothetical protein
MDVGVTSTLALVSFADGASELLMPAAIGDPGELFHIDMYELPRTRGLDPTYHTPAGAIHPPQAIDAVAHEHPVHVDPGIPRIPAIRAGPSFRCVRKPRICRSRWRLVRIGLWCGRLERSTSPAHPSWRYRLHHLCAVWRETFIDSAAAATDHPDSMRWHSRNRLSGVSGALRCMVSPPGSCVALRQLHTRPEGSLHQVMRVNNVLGYNT